MRDNCIEKDAQGSVCNTSCYSEIIVHKQKKMGPLSEIAGRGKAMPEGQQQNYRAFISDKVVDIWLT